MAFFGSMSTFEPVTYQRFSVYGGSGFLPAALFLRKAFAVNGRWLACNPAP